MCGLVRGEEEEEEGWREGEEDVDTPDLGGESISTYLSGPHTHLKTTGSSSASPNPYPSIAPHTELGNSPQQPVVLQTTTFTKVGGRKLP